MNELGETLSFILIIIFIVAIFSLPSIMRRADCNAGIKAACAEIEASYSHD